MLYIHNHRSAYAKNCFYCSYYWIRRVSCVFVERTDGLVVGEVVSIKGIVEEERKFGSGKALIVNDIPVFCECSKNYIGLNVVVYGVVERFPEDLRVRAFKIKVIS